MTLKRALIGLLVAAVLLAGGVFTYLTWFAPVEEAAAVIPVATSEGPRINTEPVAVAIEADRVSSEGHVLPLRHAAVAPAGSGVVAEVLVAEGAAVVAGQPILRLESAAEEASLRGAEAALAGARAARDAAVAGVEAARLAGEAADLGARAAELQLALASAEPRPEDIALGESGLALAEAQLAAATAAQAQALEGAGAARIRAAEADWHAAEAAAVPPRLRLEGLRQQDNPDAGDLAEAERAYNAALAAIEAARVTYTELQAGATDAQRAAAANGVTAAAAQRDAAAAQRDMIRAGGSAEAIDVARAGVSAAAAAQTEAQAALALAETAVNQAEAGVAGAESAVLAAQAQALEGAGAARIRAAEADWHAAEAAAVPPRLRLEGLRQQDNPDAGDLAEAVRAYNAALAAIEAARVTYTELQNGATDAQRAAAANGVTAAAAQRDAAAAQLDMIRAGGSAEAIDVARAWVSAAAAAQAEAQAALALAETAVNQAEAGVAGAEAAVLAAQAALDNRTLAAPFDGTVADLPFAVGEVVPPGVPAAVVADFSGWLVETSELLESDVVGVAAGFPAEVTVDALPGQTLTGVVTAVGAIAQELRGDTIYPVTVRLDNVGDLPLRWGMTVFVTIRTEGQ